METQALDLPNGLRVLVRESHDHPVVTVDAWINTGSINEPSAINGVSHFLEHMLFKGTTTRGPNELDLMIESLGGDWNAATSKDYTHYYCTVPSPHRAVAMDAVADMLRRPAIDPVELEKERLVILEEYLRNQDSPYGLLWDELYTAAYAASPYRPTILGSEEAIRGISREAMRDYFERYYAPENMVLIVAGDIALDEARSLATRHFGDWERRFQPLEGLDRSIRRERGRRVEIERDVNDTYYAMIFPGAGFDRLDETYALDLLDGVLGDGRAARLRQRLVEDLRLAHSVGCGAITQKSDGLFIVMAELAYEKIAPFRAAVLEEFDRMAQTGPTERELARVKTGIYTHEAFETETTTGQTSRIGYCYTLTGGTAFEEEYLDRLMQVESEEVKAVAGQFLRPDELNEVLIRPRSAT